MRSRLASAGCLLSLTLAAPSGLASQWEPDSIIIHSIDAGEPLLELLSGVAAETRGAFVPEEAERIHREIWGLAAPSRYTSNQQQIERSYSYLARARRNEEVQGILSIRLLSTQPYRFDVRIRATAGIMKPIRKLATKLKVDPLMPIDRVRLVLQEERGPYEPRLILSLTTARQFDCLGYYIDYDLRQDADTLRLTLHGAGKKPGPCPAEVGPAVLSRDLRLSHRDYTVYVTHRDRTDRLFFDITDSTTAVTGRDSSLVVADERLRLRYPRNSFAFRCANMRKALTFCNDVDYWLGHQRGISRYDFPNVGLNPYRPDPASRPGEGIRFFRYDSPYSFEYLRICFGAIDSTIRAAAGVTLTLEDWQGRSITALQTAPPGDELPAEYPAWLRRLPEACRFPYKGNGLQ